MQKRNVFNTFSSDQQLVFSNQFRLCRKDTSSLIPEA